MKAEGNFRFESKFPSRSAGTISFNKSLYNCRSNFVDRSSAKKFYFQSRGPTCHSEMMLPAGVSPKFKKRIDTPEAFASEIERCEKRKDSQLFQEVIVSLPHELTVDQLIILLRMFVYEVWVSQGRIAQIDIHPPPPDGDPRHVHAHILLSLREITNEGFGNKVREWTDYKNRSLVKEWREKWADAVNAAYERHGHKIRVDHRSLKDRGIDRVPQKPKGQARTNAERKEKKLKEQARQREITDSRDIDGDQLSRDFDDFYFND